MIDSGLFQDHLFQSREKKKKMADVLLQMLCGGNKTNATTTILLMSSSAVKLICFTLGWAQLFVGWMLSSGEQCWNR
jgi:hypothetical protein